VRGDPIPRSGGGEGKTGGVRVFDETGGSSSALWILCAGLGLLPAEAPALSLFTNKDAFLAAAGAGITLESFEGLSDRGLSGAPIVAPELTVVPIGGIADVRSTPLDGHFPTDGTEYVSYGLTSAASGGLDFDLVQASTAFGLFITDFGDVSQGSLSLSTDVGEGNAGLLIAQNPPPQPNGNLLFFGIIQNTPFSVVHLTLTTPNDGIGVDQIYMQSIPEPGMIPLLCAGASVLVLRGKVRLGKHLAPACAGSSAPPERAKTTFPP